MYSFSSYLKEDAQGKNLHLEHLEDEIINFGIGGARGAINFLQSLRDMRSHDCEVGWCACDIRRRRSV